MTQFRPRAAPAAESLWRALKSGRTLSATDSAREGLASAVYARKTMRAWAKAGYAVRIPTESAARDAADLYALKPDAPDAPPVVTTQLAVLPRAGYMTAAEFAATRRRLGFTLKAMGEALGRTGHPNSTSREMRRYEAGRPIDQATADKVRALLVLS